MNPALSELFEGKSVAIAGYGVEGKAAYQLLSSIECDITIIDQNESTDVPSGVESQLRDHWLDDISNFDLVLRTSGMHPDKLEGAKHVTTSTDVLLQLYGQQTIALTGTKGKTTTVKITTELLRSADLTVELVGNVGRSAWEVLASDVSPETVIVAELSSFQLSDANHSPHIAGMLPITDDHLDWHKDREHYRNSKLNLIRHQNQLDTVIADKQTIAELNVATNTSANVKTTDEFITQQSIELVTSAGQINISELKLRGQHNVDDIKLAFSLTVEYLHKRGQALTDHWQGIRRTVVEFEPLEFHLETVGLIDGRTIINDSYGSNPTATLAAIRTVNGKKVLILGGHTKGFKFEELVNEFDSNDVSAVVIIGASEEHCDELAELVHKHSQADVDIVGEQNSDTILARALRQGDQRTTILFSPAHASFDMYTNFNERGRLFTEAVQNHEGFSETS